MVKEMNLENDSVECEDEWSEIQDRFKKEGLDFDTLGSEERLLHLWRWLVDAESNLHTSRRQLDKLRDLRTEEMEEMENYIGHIRELAEKRTGHLETETIMLRSKLESSQQQAATLATLLEKSGLEGIAEESLGEQVAFLIADRSKLIEEIDILKKVKFSNGVNGMSKEGDLITEIIKVSSEKEVLRREISEMCDRVQLLEKASRQLELDNERLAFKLSEALAELEERESQLKHLGLSDNMDHGTNICWPSVRYVDSPHLGSRRSVTLHQRSESPKDASRQPSVSKNTNDSGKLSCVDSGGEYSQVPSLDSAATQGETEHDNRDTDLKSLSHSFGADSTPPSLLLSEISGGSPKKLSCLLHSQSAESHSELVQREEIQKLQAECDFVKGQVNTITEKYNALALKHIQLKAKRKAQIDDLRNKLDVEVSSLQCQVQNLQSQLTVQKKMLIAEEGFRDRIENDYRQLQEEKRSLMVSVMHLESTLREKDRELSVLSKKVTLLENANSDLLAKVLQLKYASTKYTTRSVGFVPKSNSVEGILTDLGTV